MPLSLDDKSIQQIKIFPLPSCIDKQHLAFRCVVFLMHRRHVPVDHQLITEIWGFLFNYCGTTFCDAAASRC